MEETGAGEGGAATQTLSIPSHGWLLVVACGLNFGFYDVYRGNIDHISVAPLYIGGVGYLLGVLAAGYMSGARAALYNNLFAAKQ